MRNPASGRVGRREAIVRLAALGAAASGLASVMAAATPRRVRAATVRGGSGTLKLLYWQAPTILNPHLALGSKDWDAARICCEPLLTVDATGTFTPVLAANVPSRANGQVRRARDPRRADRWWPGVANPLRGGLSVGAAAPRLSASGAHARDRLLGQKGQLSTREDDGWRTQMSTPRPYWTGAVIPAPLLGGLRIHVPQRAPDPQVAVADRQPRRA
jgi:hypothetical protein